MELLFESATLIKSLSIIPVVFEGGIVLYQLNNSNDCYGLKQFERNY